MAGCDDCRFRCGKGRIQPEVAAKIEQAYKTISNSNSKSLVKKHLTKETYEKLKDITTPMGSTLLDCIQSGAANLDSGVGLYAPDADAYTVFHELFNPLIAEYHSFKNSKHPPSCWGDPAAFSNIDPSNKYIISTRVRTGRSIKDYPFAAKMTEDDYKELEQKISMAVNSFQGELQGTYYPLKLLVPTEQQKLVDDHYLFKEGDRFLTAAKICRFWPTGRGIFYNPSKTFIVWINEEDHMRIISMQKGGDIMAVYKRLKEGAEYLETCMEFAHNDKYGYLTSCPTNIGTAIRASVHISLPHLAANRTKLEEIAGRYNLQVRGTEGEHTESVDNVYDISNKRRLGLTEFMAIKEMSDGIRELIKHEESGDE